jgi:sulfur carrier protein
MSEKSALRTSITLNGDPYIIEGDARVAKLIEALEMKPTRVAVEINGAIIPKAEYDETLIGAGNVVEVINFVGGG